MLPDSGDAEVNGHSIVHERIFAQNQIGYLPETTGGFEDLRTREFLSFAANTKGLFSHEAETAIDRIVSILDLEPVWQTELGNLSKGWRQRAWLAQTLINDPPVLFLDEPTDGLDPIQKLTIRKFLQEIAKSKTILMSAHILEEAELLCKKVVIMGRGRILDFGPTSNFLSENGRLEAKIKMLIYGQEEKLCSDV